MCSCEWSVIVGTDFDVFRFSLRPCFTEPKTDPGNVSLLVLFLVYVLPYVLTDGAVPLSGIDERAPWLCGGGELYATIADASIVSDLMCVPCMSDEYVPDAVRWSL